MLGPSLERVEHRDDGTGRARPALLWRAGEPMRALSTAVFGGGLGVRHWVINAEVTLDYQCEDPARHASAIADDLDVPSGEGIVLLTAARVLDVATAADEGATCAATVGVSLPTWAAAPDGAWSSWQPGTINLLCWVPAPLSDAALANLVVTTTEAKTQALLDAGVPGTGTASDAVVVCCPIGGTEPYGGPRSHWGARAARAVHEAVTVGLDRYLARTQ